MNNNSCHNESISREKSPFCNSFPLVSGVIATYNDAKYLTTAIESVLGQKYEPLVECIVIDDGSKDETNELVNQWTDNPNFKYIRIEHKGLSHARNIGIEAARGEYVAFLDADDWWHPEKICRQLQFIRSRSEVAFCWCNIILKEEADGKETILNGKIEEKVDLAKHVFINGTSRAQLVSYRTGYFPARYKVPKTVPVLEETGGQSYLQIYIAAAVSCKELFPETQRVGKRQESRKIHCPGAKQQYK